MEGRIYIVIVVLCSLFVGTTWAKEYSVPLQESMSGNKHLVAYADGVKGRFTFDTGCSSLTINKTLEYRHKLRYWRAGPPKTAHSYRTIPLTDRAHQILKECYDERETRKEAESLSQVLEYTDRRTGETRCLVMRDLIFINYRTGEPAKNSSYDTHLYKLCDEAGIRRFCMHALRHTYATRAIESGVQPKVLQQLLGHASIKTTMDRYVHVTDDSLTNAVKLFSQNRKVEVAS